MQNSQSEAQFIDIKLTKTMNWPFLTFSFGGLVPGTSTYILNRFTVREVTTSRYVTTISVVLIESLLHALWPKAILNIFWTNNWTQLHILNSVSLLNFTFCITLTNLFLFYDWIFLQFTCAYTLYIYLCFMIHGKATSILCELNSKFSK